MINTILTNAENFVAYGEMKAARGTIEYLYELVQKLDGFDNQEQVNRFMSLLNKTMEVAA